MLEMTSTRAIDSDELRVDRRTERGWLLLYIAALCSAAVRGVQRESLHQTHTLIGSYWADFYTATYAAGDRRRALVGTVVAAIHPGGVSLLWLNVAAILILAAILAIFLRSLRLSAGPSPSLQQRLCHFAILGGVLVSIPWEVLGDLLQIDLLLFLGGAFLLRRFVPRPNLRVAFALISLVPLALVHEAAIFLLPPFIPYLRRRDPGVRDFALPAVIAIVLLGGSLLWGLSGQHVQHIASASLNASTRTPPFSALLREEVQHDLHGKRMLLAFLSRVLRIACVLMATMVTFTTMLGSRSAGFVRTFLSALVFSSPLWLIAHDWGRFLAYLALLSLIVRFSWLDDAAQFLQAPGRIAGPLSSTRNPLVLTACLAILLLGAGHEARVSGMDLHGFLAALPLIIVAGGDVASKLIGKRGYQIL